MKTKVLSILLAVTLLMALLIPAAAAADSEIITIETTLTDGMMLKGSKKTFDVIARLDGKKISSSVTLNGDPVGQTWSDATKDSYTLVFTREGENIIEVTAASGSQSKAAVYRIQYEKAADGDLIGYATWTVETLTIGAGFVVDPIQVPIYEGENAAQTLNRVLTEQGFAFDYTGRLESGFYLSAVANGGHPDFKKGGCQTEGAKLKVPVDPTDTVPDVLRKVLEDNGSWPPDSAWYEEDGEVYALGEFDYTFMSGWMYAVNGVFPNVGFSDSYLTDGDVVRVQFTLYGYGADIGGGYAMGGGTTDYYSLAQKDRLLSILAALNAVEDKDDLLSDQAVKTAYEAAMSAAEKLDASQDSVDEAAANLSEAVQTHRDNRQAAADVDAKIEAIGTVALDSEKAVEDARAAYESLTEAQKALVSKLSVLEKAEKDLADLKATEADKAAAADVDATIEAIGTVTLDSEKAVREARAAYESLTEAQKALVGKLSVLEKAEKDLADLKTASTPETGDKAPVGTVVMLLAAAGCLIGIGSRRKISSFI